MDQFTIRHEVVHNGGSPNYQELLLDKKATCKPQILHSLSYKVCCHTTKVKKIWFVHSNSSTFTIMDQRTCCFYVRTSETGLYGFEAINLHAFPFSC